MNRPHSKLHQHQKEQEQSTTHQHQAREAQSHTAVEFATADEMLRYEAAHTTVPPAVAERLQKSVEREQLEPRPSWWQRLFGR